MKRSLPTSLWDSGLQVNYRKPKGTVRSDREEQVALQPTVGIGGIPALFAASGMGFTVQLGGCSEIPRGSIDTTIMESGPKSHNGDGLLGPNSIMVVYMDPLGLE